MLVKTVALPTIAVKPRRARPVRKVTVCVTESELDETCPCPPNIRTAGEDPRAVRMTGRLVKCQASPGRASRPGADEGDCAISRRRRTMTC